MEVILRESEIPVDLAEFFEPISPDARKDVFTIATAPFGGCHFATYPPALVEPCVLASTSEYGCCGAKKIKLRVRQDLTPDERAKVDAFLKSKGWA
jgi:hypothetical protein